MPAADHGEEGRQAILLLLRVLTERAWGGQGRHADGGMVVEMARMLGALGAAGGGQWATALIADEGELTRQEWEQVLERIQPDTHGNVELESWRQENPRVLAAMPPPELPPGLLETMRRGLLGILRRGGWEPGAPVPAGVLEGVLDGLEGAAAEVGVLSGQVAREVARLGLGLVPRRDDLRVWCPHDTSATLAVHAAMLLSQAARRGLVTLELSSGTLAAACAALAMAGHLPLAIVLRERPLARWEVEPRLEGMRRRPDILLGDGTEIEVKARQSRLDLELIGPEARDGGPRHDVVLACPPLGDLRGGFPQLGRDLPAPPSAEALNVAMAAARARSAALCVVSGSFLFRTTQADQAFKDVLLRRHGLAAVAALPPRSFGARGPGLAASVVVLRPDHGASGSNVLMAALEGEGQTVAPHRWADRLLDLLDRGATDDASALVSPRELREDGFNLGIDRHVLAPDARTARDIVAHGRTVPLADLVEIHRPQGLPAATGGGGEEGDVFLEVGVADLDEAGLVREPTKPVLATARDRPRARRAILQPGDVLVAIKGSVGKVGYVREMKEEAAWVASPSFAVLRLRQGAPLRDPAILHRFLASPVGQALIRSVRGGTAVPTLPMRDLERIPVLLPEPGTEDEIAREIKLLFGFQDTIAQLRREAARRHETAWPVRGHGDGSSRAGETGA